MKANKFIITTVAPAGIENIYEKISPKMKDKIETMAEFMTTDLKHLHTLTDERVGKTIRLETSRAPIIRMPTTIITPVKIASRVLYNFTFIPVAFAKFSSNVTKNILLYDIMNKIKTMDEINILKAKSD